jgi:hypothetical protein
LPPRLCQPRISSRIWEYLGLITKAVIQKEYSLLNVFKDGVCVGLFCQEGVGRFLKVRSGFPPKFRWVRRRITFKGQGKGKRENELLRRSGL